MPIYEYECKKCKSHIEVLQKASDKPPTKCAKCRGTLERVASAPAIQFKGTGWYVTDYAKKSKGGDKSESESKSVSTSSDDNTDKKSKESSPAKKTSEKASPPKTPSGD